MGFLVSIEYAEAANITTVKCGTAVTGWVSGYEDHVISDDGHIILGENLQDSKAIYKFHFPPPYGGNNITSIGISIYGSGDITDLWIGGTGGINYNSVSDNWVQGFNNTILAATGDAVGGYLLEIQIDVTDNLDRYDLEKIAERVTALMELEASDIWAECEERKRAAARNMLC